MKFVFHIFLALLSVCFPAFAQSGSSKICLAYCTYYGNMLPDPDLVTHINYAFAELYVKNGVYQQFKLQGNESRFKSVMQLKQQNPNLKICLSFTHTVSNSDNSQGGGFSAMAASPEMRKQFAADCLAFCQKWNLDGIDIDWEFPGLSWSGHAANPAVDTQNYVLLMKQLRETLGPDRILSFAGYVMDMKSSDSGKKYVDIQAVMPYVDYVCIMTYDMDAAPAFQSAIISSNSYYDCLSAIRTYARLGVPFQKMLLGIPFYLRHSFDGITTVVDYKQIQKLKSNPNFEFDLWDEEARTPYARYKGEFYGSYDNPRSIAIKGEWAHHLGLGGLFYWENSEDDADMSLAKACWNVISKYSNDE